MASEREHAQEAACIITRPTTKGVSHRRTTRTGGYRDPAPLPVPPGLPSCREVLLYPGPLLSPAQHGRLHHCLFKGRTRPYQGPSPCSQIHAAAPRYAPHVREGESGMRTLLGGLPARAPAPSEARAEGQASLGKRQLWDGHTRTLCRH